MTDTNTTPDPVLVEFDNGIAFVTLNRPEKRNAMNPKLNMRMLEVLDELEADDRCGVLVLRGGDGDLHRSGDHENAGEQGGRRACPGGARGGGAEETHCATMPPPFGWKVSGPRRMPSAVSFSANLGRMPVGLRTPR